jgi:hypothetical protein
LELGGVGWLDAAEINGGTAGLDGAGGERMELIARPSWQRHKREKASLLECTNTERRLLLVNKPRHLGPVGPSGEVAAYSGGGLALVELGRSG